MADSPERTVASCGCAVIVGRSHALTVTVLLSAEPQEFATRTAYVLGATTGGGVYEALVAPGIAVPVAGVPPSYHW